MCVHKHSLPPYALACRSFLHIIYIMSFHVVSCFSLFLSGCTITPYLPDSPHFNQAYHPFNKYPRGFQGVTPHQFASTTQCVDTQPSTTTLILNYFNKGPFKPTNKNLCLILSPNTNCHQEVPNHVDLSKCVTAVIAG